MTSLIANRSMQCLFMTSGALVNFSRTVSWLWSFLPVASLREGFLLTDAFLHSMHVGVWLHVWHSATCLHHMLFGCVFCKGTEISLFSSSDCDYAEWGLSIPIKYVCFINDTSTFLNFKCFVGLKTVKFSKRFRKGNARKDFIIHSKIFHWALLR